MRLIGEQADIRKNLEEVRRECAAAAERSGRAPEAVKIVAVSKTVAGSRVIEAARHGLRIFGENRVQELLAKQDEVGTDVEWHFIGHLQRNKVKHLLGRAALIHSLDRWSLAEEIQRRAKARGLTVPVLVQVNVAGERTKKGLAPNEVIGFLKNVAGFSRLRVEGLMTIAPYSVNPEDTRPVFRELRLLRNQARLKLGMDLPHLSMGMSNDYPVAIEEGADLVRLGTVIFGKRGCRIRGVSDER